MTELFVQSVSLVVSTTLAFYLVTVSVQIGRLVNDGIRVRTVPGVPVLAALWQNIGLGGTLLGLVYGDAQLTAFGVMFLALRTLLQPLDAPSHNPTTERLLLTMALVSLMLLAAIRIVARLT